MIDKTLHRPRVLFFGMQGSFSVPSLQALLARNMDVCAVVVPMATIPGLEVPAIRLREATKTGRPSLRLLHQSPSIIEIARTHDIPVWEVNRLSDAMTHATLASYAPDVLCVACFSRRIPRSIIEVPRLGALNVHPSLLPANRGPVPLFWTFRNGDKETGVSIHFLEETLDTGDILAQVQIKVPNGISYAQLEVQCATKGGELLAQAIESLYTTDSACLKQDESKSSYYPFYTQDDLVVDVAQWDQWDARRVYNFIRGVGHIDEPVALKVKERMFLTRECLSYSLEAMPESLDETGYVQRDTSVDIRCKQGWVRIREITDF